MSHCFKNLKFQISEVATLCIAQILDSPPLSNESARTHTRHQMHPHYANHQYLFTVEDADPRLNTDAKFSAGDANPTPSANTINIYFS